MRKTTPGVIFALAALAWLIAPISFRDTRIPIPPGTDLDAVEACLLVGDGMDKLLARPAACYDTAILYPDHHQLRTTEPFLGFALLGQRAYRHSSASFSSAPRADNEPLAASPPDR